MGAAESKGGDLGAFVRSLLAAQNVESELRLLTLLVRRDFLEEHGGTSLLDVADNVSILSSPEDLRDDQALSFANWLVVFRSVESIVAHEAEKDEHREPDYARLPRIEDRVYELHKRLSHLEISEKMLVDDYVKLGEKLRDANELEVLLRGTVLPEDLTKKKHLEYRRLLDEAFEIKQRGKMDRLHKDQAESEMRQLLTRARTLGSRSFGEFEDIYESGYSEDKRPAVTRIMFTRVTVRPSLHTDKGGIEIIVHGTPGLFVDPGYFTARPDLDDDSKKEYVVRYAKHFAVCVLAIATEIESLSGIHRPYTQRVGTAVALVALLTPIVLMELVCSGKDPLRPKGLEKACREVVRGADAFMELSKKHMMEKNGEYIQGVLPHEHLARYIREAIFPE